MRKAFVAVMVLAALSGAAARAEDASKWSVEAYSDPLGRGELRGACQGSGDFKLCVSFQAKGVFFTLTLSGFDLVAGRFPSYRVDGSAPLDAVPDAVRDAERVLGEQMLPRTLRERLQHWRAQVPDASGEWQADPPLLIRQMRSGDNLQMRIWLESGKNVDVSFPLAGFCEVAAEVYYRGAPPLNCG